MPDSSINGPSANGPSANGPSANGPSANGPSANGPLANGRNPVNLSRTQTARTGELDRQECVKVCLECYRVCLETVTYCLRMEGEYIREANLRLLFDSADVCNNSVSVMMRGIRLQTPACDIEGKVRDRCAEMCEQFLHDAQMVRCAEICRQCAAVCRQLFTYSPIPD